MTDPAPKILIVDDEPPMRRLLTIGLTADGFRVTEATNGRGALDRMAEGPDLVILDLGLPDMSGQEVLARWRAAGLRIPVVILSSRTDEAGIVEALELGADDYVTKPFGMRELLARIRVALRHGLQAQGREAVFATGGLVVDLVRRSVRSGDRAVHLTPKEYDLLRVMVEHAGRALTHRFLLQQVWGPEADIQYLRVYMRQLRQKIEDQPDRPRYILTETGIGYRLAEIAAARE